MVMSPLALASTWSTGEKATFQTARLWPLSVEMWVSSGKFHSRTVLSWEHVASIRSLGAHDTALTSFSWASTVLRHRIEHVPSARIASIFHIFKARSAPALANHLGSLRGKAKAATPSV